MTKLVVLILACLALGPIAAGCGGDDSGDGGGGGGNGGGGGAAAGTEVSMEDIQFKPDSLTVAPGDTITFTNNEALPHDVHKTSGPGDDFASGASGGMMEGDTYELTLEEPGSYEYVCDVHAPGMKGTITVE
jgi:plastocyanin